MCAALVGSRHAGGSPPTLGRLGWRGASRNWLRSLLTVALLAAASFIIVTVAVNRRDLSRIDYRSINSGAGGFSFVARCDVPIQVDLNTVAGREEMGFSPEESAALAQARIFAFRASSGDDISCLNVQKPSVPRVLGVPREFIERGGFRFADVADAAATGPWEALQVDLPAVEEIPAIGDAASLKWILRKNVGDLVEVPSTVGNALRLRVIGLLADSIFASELLISEEQFVEYLGTESGYRYFLVDTPQGTEQAAAAALRSALGELGLEVISTGELLSRYAAVQNTYLATFQTLGGLGLLLGTLGMVTVLLRGIVERRQELAIMVAVGIRRSRVVAMIVLENGILLALGLAIGTATALVAVMPHLASTVADVRWSSLAATLAACGAAGLVSCGAAALLAMRGPLLPALRSE
jgi:hypothetical protein